MVSNKTLSLSGHASDIDTFYDSMSISLAIGVDAKLKGDEGANTISGSAFSEWIYGFGGNDTLMGNGGADRLFGGTGNDILHGGAGGDIFVFKAGDGDDTIRDFKAGTDVLDFMEAYGIDDMFDALDRAEE